MEDTLIKENFNLYCYIELPIFVNGFLYVWNETNTNCFLENVLNKRLGMHAPIHSKFEMNYKMKSDVNDCFNILKYPIKTDKWGYMICRLLEYTAVR